VKILFCSEFFYPSIGGAQEVVKQLAYRFIERGHEVDVATSALSERTSNDHLGIKIHSFNIGGNSVNGISGDVESYRDFITTEKFDIIFIYAAQQWTFDAIKDILPLIDAQRVFVPCGYSGLFQPAYKEYFERLPEYLKSFQAVIYHSLIYRDYKFGQQHHLENAVFIPNAADNKEFTITPKPRFKTSYSISARSLVILTVGSLNSAKGHLEVAKAFAISKLAKPTTLILNGSPMPKVTTEPGRNVYRKIINLFRNRGFVAASKFFIVLVARQFGLRPDYFMVLNKLILDVNTGNYGQNKKVLLLNLQRDELIEAFFESDLFVFASLIEYSPLVLFEACAAGLPFLSSPVGNAAEIVDWTNGGKLCKAKSGDNGFIHVDIDALAKDMESLLMDPITLQRLGDAGRLAWKTQFNWDSIADRYEELFMKLLKNARSA
jgi:glycosyltransferase involved in cell wall biosynthesis